MDAIKAEFKTIQAEGTLVIFPRLLVQTAMRYELYSRNNSRSNSEAQRLISQAMFAVMCGKSNRDSVHLDYPHVSVYKDGKWIGISDLPCDYIVINCGKYGKYEYRPEMVIEPTDTDINKNFKITLSKQFLNLYSSTSLQIGRQI